MKPEPMNAARIQHLRVDCDVFADRWFLNADLRLVSPLVSYFFTSFLVHRSEVSSSPSFRINGVTVTPCTIIENTTQCHQVLSRDSLRLVRPP
jgi:hypothetical protein